MLFVTTGYRMIALNAKTGQPVTSFGKHGIVDLKEGVVYGNGPQIDLETGEIGVHSTPTVVNDVVLVGSSFKEGMTVETSQQHQGAGARLRRPDRQDDLELQHDSPPGEFGNETWDENSWAFNGNTGVWTQITVDPRPGWSICRSSRRRPTSTAASVRATTCSARSLVAVDLKTGKRKWHFQFVHHPIWDHDMSSAPLLMDVTIDGKPRKVVAVPSKQAGCTSSTA